VASRKLIVALLLLFPALLIAVIVALSTGAQPVSWQGLRESGSLDQTIVFDLRLPRVLLAALVGAVLASSGATFQTLLRNPLADPFILGISGGAACGAALVTALGLARTAGGITIGAFAGAIVATAAIFLLARRRRGTDVVRLLMAGLVLNSLFSAIILLALSVTRGADLSAALRWMMGSLAGASWGQVAILAPLLAGSLILLQSLAGDFRLLDFGEEDARARGVAVDRVRMIGFSAASLATGASVAVAGVIGFVGLMVPYMVRSLLRTDYRVVLPVSALAGAVLLVLSDAAARSAVPPLELPLGALLALLGVPFFIWILRRQA
jgi:iron complex transport system permease protein